MTVKAILAVKGTDIHTIEPTTNLAGAATGLGIMPAYVATYRNRRHTLGVALSAIAAGRPKGVLDALYHRHCGIDVGSQG